MDIPRLLPLKEIALRCSRLDHWKIPNKFGGIFLGKYLGVNRRYHNPHEAMKQDLFQGGCSKHCDFLVGFHHEKIGRRSEFTRLMPLTIRVFLHGSSDFKIASGKRSCGDASTWKDDPL